MGWVSALGREVGKVIDVPAIIPRTDATTAAGGAVVGAVLPADTAEERAANVLGLAAGGAVASRVAREVLTPAPQKTDAERFLEGPGNEVSRIFGGQQARTADLKQLEKAQAMEGAGIEPREIWQQTGWLKGEEGAWRFEINDEAAQFRLEETPKVAWEFDLDEVFDHPELFAAYPELRSAQVVFKDLGPLARDAEGEIVQGSQGAYDKFFRSIILNNRLTREEAREAILHETQHTMQDIEGFAQGGMPEAGREFFQTEEIEQAFVRLGDLKLRHDAATDDVTRAAIRKDMDTLKQQITEQAQIEAYQRLPGEVEARLVERRKDLTAGQRRQEFPNDMRDMEPVAQAEPMGMAASSFPRPVAIVREAQQIAVKEFEQRTDKIFEKFGLEADAERASMREQLQTEAYDVIETRSAEIRTAEQVKANEALAKVPEQVAAYRQKNADRFDEDALEERAAEYERALEDRINERMERSIERQVDKLESEVDDHMVNTMWEKYEDEIGVEKTREMISELRSVTEEYRAQYGDDFIKSLSEEEGNNRIWWDDWTEGESALAMRGGPLTRTERAEWQQAEAKGLDMSEPARAQRAEAQGYTIEAFRGIRVAPGAGELTDKQILGGAWFAETPETANSYAADVMMSRNKGFVMKARLKMENPLVIDAGGAMFDRIAVGKLKGIFPDGLLEGKKHLTTQEVASLARAMGHDGVEFQNIRADRDSTALTTKPGKIWVSFKPENVRSANAAFDPMAEGQAGLMLSQKGGPLVDQARQQGYKGENTGESAEWVAAVAKGLDMSTPARMARAKEMGFDTDTTVYHGTPVGEFSEFDTYGGKYGLFGLGTYTTESADVASSYARPRRGMDQSTVFPLKIRKGRVMDMDEVADMQQALRWRSAMKDADIDGEEIGYAIGDLIADGKIPEMLDEMTNEHWFRVAEEILTAREMYDYEGAEVMADIINNMNVDTLTHMGGGRVRDASERHRVWIVLDPSNIRSVHAAFDPDNKASSALLAGFGDDLLTASMAGGAIASAMMARDDILNDEDAPDLTGEDEPEARPIPANAAENAVRRIMENQDALYGENDMSPELLQMQEERAERDRRFREYQRDNPDG